MVARGKVLVERPAAEVFADYGVDELIDFISQLDRIDKKDPTALIWALREDKFVDPQCARIHHRDSGRVEIEYTFLLNVYTNSPWPVYRVNNGAVRWLRHWLPKERYRVEVEDKTVVDGNMASENATLRSQEYDIKVFYLAKDAKDIERIRRFLEKIPIDGGGLPKKGETFFCYD